ncbi:hypothetical protein UFOVP503_22 [uncultured Caudovirales phage]|uniref:Uncharacterized protein n=1 Tax=uncultured Caudovirales phage TaxID=2100421 RepID=A0A6J5NN49_9CAUD|nr:hypothetical protein UFOVP503_22 [uncultured Caudovirales phage]CAB4160839.1 hypothetical protein UFOVP763_16 [uncultured Caudovirales phage]
MINLQTLPANEAERLAYAEGFTDAAALFARIADLEAEAVKYQDELNRMHDHIQSLEDKLGSR